MKQIIIVIVLFLLTLPSFSQNDSVFVRKIYDEALEKGQAHENLRYLCKNIGARITASAEAEMAVRWGFELLKSYAFDSVYLQETKVPHWERGTTEAAWISNSSNQYLKLNVLALGGSVATNGLIEAEVVVVQTIDELKTKSAKEIKDKIVFINQAFDQKFINTFSSYGHCYPIRANGASEASKLGAKAVIIRSLSTPTDHFAHTGVLNYDETIKKIPAAAISTKDADALINWYAKEKIKFSLEMDCKTYPEAISYNVIGEMKGTKDNKIITFGGHLDSWDVGEGAHDDGAGIVHSIEALRILKQLNYKPNHTLRCVLFMNEENGNFGGKTYAQLAKQKKEQHIAAIESDRGGFLPIGFDVRGTDEQLKLVQQYQKLLFDYDLLKFKKGYSGVDISPLMDEYPEMIQIGIAINSQQYFNYHHSHADVFETVNKRELELGTAAMATIVYLLDKTLE